MNTCISIFIIL